MAGHLIHVGYPKTGSTFLQRWFSAHPQLAHVPGGIAGHADAFGIARAAVSRDPAIRFRVTSHEELTVPNHEAGHHGLRTFTDGGAPGDAQLRVCALLVGLFPTAHVLVVTRGYRAMWLSAYSEYVRFGGTMPLGGVDGAGGGPRDWWNYDGVIGAYDAAFPGRVIVLPYELLRDDAGAFLRAIEERLGLDHHPPEPERVHPSLSPVELRWYPRLTRLALALPLPRRVRRRALDRYARLVRANRLGRLVALLQRLAPAAPVTGEVLPEHALDARRDGAETLRGRPHYAAYHRDYLLEA